MEYDLLILGGGPGGYTAAERAGKAGLKVALFEKDNLGGVCLNEGCIPSKTLLNSAKLFSHARDSEVFGVSTTEVSFDQKRVIRRKNKIVRLLVSGIKQKMKQCNVEVIAAAASVKGRKDDLYEVIDAFDKTYTGKNLIIATGSEPIVPAVPGLKEALASGLAVTNQAILDLDTIPQHLVVIGAGIIGLEMASYFRTVGSEVTVIEMQDHVAGDIDRQLGDLLRQVLEKKGVKFLLEAQVTALDANAIHYRYQDQISQISTDKILCSAGRCPVADDLGLEKLGIVINNGAIQVDAGCRTNIPGVYAVGDVIGSWMLAHAAYREAEVAVNNILGQADEMSYEHCPCVIYTDPEVAWVGYSESEMERQGRKYRQVTIPFSYSGRYMAETEREPSLCKLILDEDSNTLAGCQLLGPYASEIIIAVGIMIERKLTLDEIKTQIFPHPTVAEVIREAIFML